MQYLRIYKNNYEAKTDFSHLPEGIQVVDVSYTNLSGEIPVRNRTTRFLIGHSNVELVQYY